MIKFGKSTNLLWLTNHTCIVRYKLRRISLINHLFTIRRKFEITRYALIRALIFKPKATPSEHTTILDALINWLVILAPM